MKLPPASKLYTTQLSNLKRKTDKTIEQIVNDFLDGELRESIIETVGCDGNWVNVKIPNEAYKSYREFYDLAIKKLKALGYDAYESHDGAGMYSTLGVTWKKPSRR